MVNAIFLLPAFMIGFICALLYILCFSCKHDYETRIHKVEHRNTLGDPTYTSWIYTQTCRYCGKIKTKTVALKD